MSSFVKRLKLKITQQLKANLFTHLKGRKTKLIRWFLTKAIYSIPLSYLLIVIQIILIPQPSKKTIFSQPSSCWTVDLNEFIR